MTCQGCHVTKGVAKNVCRFCGIIQTVDYDAPDGVWTNETCADCLHVYEQGREDVARAFWRAACEEKATKIESEIAATKIDWFGEGEREGYLAEAAQLRAWAAAP